MIHLIRKRMFEMALEKSKYQFRLFHLMPQIVHNWCLCEYCKRYDPTNRNYRGWRKELIAHIGNLNAIPVKGNKYKLTYDEIIKDDEFNNIRVIKSVCEYKFDSEEEINFTSDIRNELYKSFSDNVEYIVELIAGKESVSHSMIKIFDIKTEAKLGMNNGEKRI